MRQGEEQEEGQVVHPSLFAKFKHFLFARNFALVSSLKLTLPQVVALIVIEEFQKISIVTRYSVNPTLTASPEMAYVDQICRLFLLDLSSSSAHSIAITAVLLVAQVAVLLALLLPTRGEIINQMLAKMVTLMQMALTFPSLVLSVSSFLKEQNITANLFLLLLSLTNNLIYESMQIECSFQREEQNLLVRTARPVTLKILQLVMVCAFPVLSRLVYPVSFAMYGLGMLLVQVWFWLFYLHKFVYFNQALMQVRGVMLTVNISSYFCYLIIYILDNAIISQNILLFIATFSLFLANFFLTYRKYILKNIIINADLRGENEIGMYAVFYWHCFTRITEKKNELYISSLLKKHTNECTDPSCSCKNRQNLYDTYLNAYGNPNIQPHFDKIFIRHFIRKLLTDGYDQFGKSSLLALLISNYNIEVVEMITQTMELIRKLSKMQQKKQLCFTEQFLLYCLKAKTRNKIIDINLKRGNADLESVQKFDSLLILLKDSLKDSLKIYHSLWKQLQNSKLNETLLYSTCKSNLQLMFSIQNTYKQLKSINTESTQLRSIMLFYARMVVHDIHMLSQVKKDIKNGHQRNMAVSTLELSNIQFFGSNTVAFISLENARIRWTSRNAHKFFEYSKQQFHNVTIKHLMPKYFAERHDLYVERWKNTGHHVKLNNSTYLWGSYKNGTCFSMLMFVKVVPLLQDQDYAFFSAMEKLDDEAELICGPFGEVYGAGKLFARALNLSPKLIQEVQMSIQVFIPFAFDYFLQNFYPRNPKLKNTKKNAEIRRDGYFPDNLEGILRDLQEERRRFLVRCPRGDGFEKEYLGLVRQQMQQITCNINGEYISISFLPFKTALFNAEEDPVVVLKISNPKKDSIQRYYGQLQQMINKLQTLSSEQNTKQSKSLFKHNKSDFFKVFLNPKRMKRLLEKEQILMRKQSISIEEEQQMKRQFTRQVSIKSKSAKDIMAHRKKLALGARIEIKNDRVRYNIYKLKKILLEEGVISRYTYNILIGKNTHLALVTEPHISDGKEEQNRTIKDFEEERGHSEGDSDSINHQSDGELAANKQNDNQTFNSASSSATFISMTNHVKMFKMKLRSLNTPRPLLLLNLTIILALMAAVSGMIYLTVSCLDNLGIGFKEFQNNQKANLIVDSLFLGQFNIVPLVQSPQNPFYLSQNKYYLSSVSQIFQNLMYLRAEYKKIDPQILGFMILEISDVETLTIREYISLMLNQILQGKFQHVMRYFVQSKDVISQYSANNIFFDRIATTLFFVFLLSIVLTFALFLLTLPVVWKLQIKIREIYGLLGKIGSNDRIKYFKHFTNLNDEFKFKEEVDSNELNHFIATYEQKYKHVKTNNSRAFSEDSVSKMQLIQPSEKRQMREKGEKGEGEDDATSLSADKFIYGKIVLVYLILIAATLFNYFFLTSFHSVFMVANNTFVQLFNEKTALTGRIVEGQYQIMGYGHESNYNSKEIGYVEVLYDTYFIPAVSDSYRREVTLFVTGMPCVLLNRTITAKEMELCNRINNGTFEQGGVDNLFYTQRKIQQKVTEYYLARNNTPNDQSDLHFPDYFLTEEFFQLHVGYFFSTLMAYELFDKVFTEISSFATNYRHRFYLSLGVSLVLIGLFTVLWLLIYLKLAQNASYINAFLLLIPFDVLSENPYIKLYIKNQFDYKANY